MQSDLQKYFMGLLRQSKASFYNSPRLPRLKVYRIPTTPNAAPVMQIQITFADAFTAIAMTIATTHAIVPVAMTNIGEIIPTA